MFEEEKSARLFDMYQIRFIPGLATELMKENFNLKHLSFMLLLQIIMKDTVFSVQIYAHMLTLKD